MDALERMKAKINERYKTNETLIFTALDSVKDFNLASPKEDLVIPLEQKPIVQIRLIVLKLRESHIETFRKLIQISSERDSVFFQGALDGITGKGAQMMVEWEVFSLAWGRLACPRVRLNQDQAAQFVISSVTPDKSETVKAPWDTFVVEFPKNLITFKNSKVPGGIDTIERVMVMAEQENFWQILIESVGYRLSYMRDTLSNLIKQTNSSPEESVPADLSTNIGDEEVQSISRATSAAARIAICTAIELQTPDSFKHTNPQHVVNWKKTEMRKRYPKPVFSNLYTFGKSVNANCFRAAKEYVAGNGSSPMVRHLVRGHYRNQAWGPKHSLRKWNYIEPFWRCSDKELTNIKTHKLI